ncbi:PIN domain-containing protein [Stenomitos frigidus]|uniref:Twitching motility protein PilT n=1 Tax=Stenomitos frigidus ULC18 TaxID=2107698 RepID=A0A2T1DXJ6_9CYAN|nr:PIN domain-containing protein [Stenomitos frigidus]PSB25161.1 twitching motility protein PilT [Stenomitos frigidus ULC18]
MNGNRYLLDTNAIIALLRGNQQVLQQLQTSEWLGISIISQLEFLSFSGLSENDREVFDQFLERVEVIGLDPSQGDLIELAIQLRQQSRLPLPDVIIAATAMHANAALITADQELQTIQALMVVAFVP